MSRRRCNWWRRPRGSCHRQRAFSAPCLGETIDLPLELARSREAPRYLRAILRSRGSRAHRHPWRSIAPRILRLRFYAVQHRADDLPLYARTPRVDMCRYVTSADDIVHCARIGVLRVVKDRSRRFVARSPRNPCIESRFDQAVTDVPLDGRKSRLLSIVVL